MYIDNLTLTGLLVSLPYLMMLMLHRSNWFPSRQAETIVLDCQDKEPYRYGT